MRCEMKEKFQVIIQANASFIYSNTSLLKYTIRGTSETVFYYMCLRGQKRHTISLTSVKMNPCVEFFFTGNIFDAYTLR